jgi:uncharacterized membrane protein
MCGKIILTSVIWAGVGFGIMMVAVLIGFLVESTQTPFLSVFIGMITGAVVAVSGWIVSIFRLLRRPPRIPSESPHENT